MRDDLLLPLAGKPRPEARLITGHFLAYLLRDPSLPLAPSRRARAGGLTIWRVAPFWSWIGMTGALPVEVGYNKGTAGYL